MNIENIKWRETIKRGRYTGCDARLTLTSHNGRNGQLRISIYSSFLKNNDYQYVALSDIKEHNDNIYFMFSKERKAPFQNKIVFHEGGTAASVLFALKDGEPKLLANWINKYYTLKPLSADVYYIEQEKYL